MIPGRKVERLLVADRAICRDATAVVFDHMIGDLRRKAFVWSPANQPVFRDTGHKPMPGIEILVHKIPVLVQTPAHSLIGAALTYQSELPLSPGTMVRVPLGRRETLGVVWDDAAAPGPAIDPARVRAVTSAYGN